MKRLPILVSLLLITLPLVLVGVYLIVREFDHQTRVALERRGAIANLGATLIHDKFDGIIDIGTALASRPLVYQNVENGKWDTAIKNMDEIPKAIPYIDSVAIYDTKGVLKAVTPLMPDAVGKSFAHRDYYQGVSREWSPYVSEVFRRATDPEYNVVSIAVPIKSPEQKTLGILLLTVKLDVIAGWGKDVDIGKDSFIFIVDKKAQLVSHPQMSFLDSLVDYSSFDTVQKLVRGERGVELHDKDFAVNERHVAAYSPVKDYGFSVEVVQPTRTAFAERNKDTVELAIIWVVIVIVINYFYYRILSDRKLMKAQRDRETILLESIGDAVVVIDRNWNITLWNKSASVLTGWSKDEALGKPIRTVLKILRERDRIDDISCMEDAMVKGKATSMSDGMLLVKKDGSEISISESAAPILVDGETHNGVIVIFRDMSVAIEKSHLRSDFMYASHQLRTPVTEALWNLEIAIDEQDHDKRKEDLRIVHQSLFSIKKLSEHLVSVSGIDQGDVAVKISPVKFIDVLTEVQSRLEVVAKMRDVTLSITPVSPLMAINTDKKLLSSVIFEIIENAVNYSHRGSKVDVLVTMQEKNLLIEVVDTGVGIPEQEQTIIFTKFFRASNHGSENPGDGLGLYLAKEYTNLIGGKIWFESVEGEGTTFFISLPIV